MGDADSPLWMNLTLGWGQARWTPGHTSVLFSAAIWELLFLLYPLFKPYLLFKTTLYFKKP